MSSLTTSLRRNFRLPRIVSSKAVDNISISIFNSNNLLANIKTKASSWYAGGTEVIFSCGGQICNSIFAAGQEAGKYTIGVDTDQSGDSDTVVTSALKDVKGATIEALNAYKKDKFQGGKTIILKNTGGIVYPGLLKNFSKEDHDAVDKKIKDGSLELKSSADVNEKTGDPSGISFDNLTVNFE